jgi:hypothetical protein
MSAIAPLFDEAWDHWRRRRRRVVLGCVAAAMVVGALFAGSAIVPPGTRRGGTAQVAPSRVLSRSPDLGVSCPVANSIACNRVGLAVWLKRPALSVTATIAGASFALDYRGDLESASQRPRLAFDGFLERAGIMSRMHVEPVEGSVVVRRHGHWVVVNRHRMWYGEYRRVAPGATVRLVIRDRSGRTVVTHVRVGLSTGWG